MLSGGGIPDHERTSASAAGTSRRPATAGLRTAWPMHRAARFTCCCRIREAEHIPGCSMAFRTRRTRGDWRLRSTVPGGRRRCRRVLATAGAGRDARVRRRLRWSGTITAIRLGAYWKQQAGYGKAEAMLERKWPEKYNVVGHLTWCGRLYGGAWRCRSGGRAGSTTAPGGWRRSRRSTDTQPGLLRTAAADAGVAPGRRGARPSSRWPVLAWPPLLLATPFFVASLAAPIAQAMGERACERFADPPSGGDGRGDGSHMSGAAAPAAADRASARPSAARPHVVAQARGRNGRRWPRPRTLPIFVGRWRAPEERLAALQVAMRATGGVVLHGGAYDAWDLEVRGGMFGSSRLLMAVEDSGSGTQLVRLRSWPYCSPAARALWLLFAALSLIAGAQRRVGHRCGVRRVHGRAGVESRPRVRGHRTRDSTRDRNVRPARRATAVRTPAPAPACVQRPGSRAGTGVMESALDISTLAALPAVVRARPTVPAAIGRHAAAQPARRRRWRC